MIVGFTYRGKHSIRDMHITHKVVSRPVPQVKEVVEDLQTIDGTMDFTDYLGHEFYSDKILEIDICVKESDPITLNHSISSVIHWLVGGYGDFIFDDMPTVIWSAKPNNISAIAESLQKIGKATVQFRCKPFNRFIFDSYGIPLSYDIKIGSDIPIGIGEIAHNIVSGANTFTVNNRGDVCVKPKIIVSGSFNKISISINDNTFIVETSISAGNDMTIDCARGIVMYNSVDITNTSSGEFPELLVGDNDVTATVRGAGGTIKFDFDYNYLFDSNWGDLS